MDTSGNKQKLIARLSVGQKEEKNQDNFQHNLKQYMFGCSKDMEIFYLKQLVEQLQSRIALQQIVIDVVQSKWPPVNRTKKENKFDKPPPAPEPVSATEAMSGPKSYAMVAAKKEPTYNNVVIIQARAKNKDNNDTKQ